MSKKLKEDYEKYTKESAPDLWSRIEASLPEKATVEQETVEPKPENIRKQSFFRKYGKFMPVAAAAVFFAVFIPVAYQVGFGSMKSMKSPSNAASEYESICADEAGTESFSTTDGTAQNMPVSEAAEPEEEISDETKELFEQQILQDTVSTEEKESQKDSYSGSGIVAGNGSDDRQNVTGQTNKEGSLLNFPFPEINQTVWEGESLVSAKVQMERMDHSIDNDTLTIECYFEVPVLLEDTQATKKINRDLYQQYENAYAEYLEWKEHYYSDTEDLLCKEGFYVRDTFLSYNAGGVISFGYSEEIWAGGVIDRLVCSYTYDLNTGKKLNLADVLGVKEENLHETLLEGFRQSAKDEPDNFLWEGTTPEELIEWLKDYDADDFHYCIGKEGEVDIWFAKYELFPGGAGTQSATIGKVNYGQ